MRNLKFKLMFEYNRTSYPIMFFYRYAKVNSYSCMK